MFCTSLRIMELELSPCHMLVQYRKKLKVKESILFPLVSLSIVLHPLHCSYIDLRREKLPTPGKCNWILILPVYGWVLRDFIFPLFSIQLDFLQPLSMFSATAVCVCLCHLQDSRNTVHCYWFGLTSRECSSKVHTFIVSLSIWPK